MAIEETNYIERVVLAFRGDVDGSFKGAHLERFNVIKRDGVEIVRQPGKATTIGEAAAAGFTWPDVVAEMNAGLVLAFDEQAAQIAQLTADNAAEAQARQAAEAALADAQGQVLALQDKLASYESPADVNGVPEWVYASQAFKALIQAGLLAFVRQKLAALPGLEGEFARADFEKSARFYRANATLNQFVTDGTFTVEAMDNLFKLARTFPV